MARRGRNCYCESPNDDPAASCGTCERCGRPGHTRHAPNGIPYTGAWCDRCYQIVRFTRPLGLWLIVYSLLAWILWEVLSRLLHRFA